MPKSSSSNHQKRLSSIYYKDYHEIARYPFFHVGSPRPLNPIKSKSQTRPTSYISPKHFAGYTGRSSSPPNLSTIMTNSHAPDMEPQDQSVFSDFKGRSDRPTPGFTYVILHQPTNRALSIIKGYPALQRACEPIPGVSHPTLLEGKTHWHWECVESDGWLSFRNAATGKFLGHDGDENEKENPNWGTYRCSSTKPGLSEKFSFGGLPLDMMISEREVDGPVEVKEEEHGEGNKRGAAKVHTEEIVEIVGDGKSKEEPQPQVQASELFSLLARSQRFTPRYPHRVARCSACGGDFWKLVKVQVKPESLAEGLQLQMVWDADEDAGTVWRFVKVVPLLEAPVEDELTYEVEEVVRA